MPGSTDSALLMAADAIDRAEAILIGAGAGMGVDSGLPDFRGDEGFWRAYPPYQKLGLAFTSLANPRWFRDDPPLAWGFYGHRLALYRGARPHEGFAILRRWAGLMPLGSFVLTSNVDGQFQKAGHDPARIWEVHGAIDRLQCLDGCGVGVFPADPAEVTIDEATMRATGPLPSCPGCGVLARPNILMFGDGHWDDSIATEQEARLESWLGTLRGRRVVAVELGVGTAIPTVRRASEQIARLLGGTLIRINPREPEVPQGHVGLPLGALEGLAAIDRILRGDRPDAA